MLRDQMRFRIAPIEGAQERQWIRAVIKYYFMSPIAIALLAIFFNNGVMYDRSAGMLQGDQYKKYHNNFFFAIPAFWFEHLLFALA